MRAFLMIAVLAVAVPDRQDPTPKEAKPHEQILGDWFPTASLIDGVERGAVPDGTIRVIWITSSATVWLENGQPDVGNTLTADIAVDWSKNPVALDLTPKQGKKMLGILKVEGDRLTLALSLNGARRPTDFGAGCIVLHFKRVKK
jgi:uncharacterized protein (TIGR03067 family)